MKTKKIHKTNTTNTKKTQNRKKNSCSNTKFRYQTQKQKNAFKVSIKGTTQQLLNIFARTNGSTENI